jgi:hypothetical protein
MSSLFGATPKVIPEFTGLQVNTSVQVLPIPIIYGSPRVSINLIYYNGFQSKMVSQKSGKGLLSGGKGAQQVEYFATIILAIGEGPIGPVQVIYDDQAVYTPSDYPTNGINYFSGTATQGPWSYISTNWPNDARGYKDTAYYGFPNAQLDSSATVPQIDLVVNGFFTGSSPLNNSTLTITSGQYDPKGNAISYIGNISLGCCDADPAQVIYDFLVNPTYGATFPSEWVDTSTLFTSPNGYDPNTGDTALSTYCQAVGLAWSTVINNVESANSLIERWTKNMNVAPIWNGAQLRFIPYWDQYNADNPNWDSSAGVPKKYFTPYTQPICVIPMDQILQSSEKGEDPITFTRKDPQEVYNTVRIDFRDRTNFFNNVPAEAKDEAHIELYGPRVDNIGSADEYSLSIYAATAATMILRRNVGIMRTFTWKMGPLWGFLDPMDIVAIPDPVNYANTINVRIVSVEDDEEENVTVLAEEFPFHSQSPTILPMSPTTPPNQGPTNDPPAPVFAPVVFAVPSGMETAQGLSTPQVLIGFSGGYNGTLDGNWGGANVWISLDNVSYQLLGSMQGPSVIGGLTANLPWSGGSNPDNTDVLYVNLSESNGSLSSVTSVAAAAGSTLCCIQDVSGFEILAYTTATLVMADTWALSGLYRGLYGTTPRFFGNGSRFLYVGQDGNFFETSLPSAYVGQTFWIKLQSFNAYQKATQDLSTCVAYVWVAGSPTPSPPVPPPTISPLTKRPVGVRSVETLGPKPRLGYLKRRL